MSLFSTHPSMWRFHEVSKVIRVPQNGWCINVPVMENAVKMDDLEVHTLFYRKNTSVFGAETNVAQRQDSDASPRDLDEDVKTLRLFLPLGMRNTKDILVYDRGKKAM